MAARLAHWSDHGEKFWFLNFWKQDFLQHVSGDAHVYGGYIAEKKPWRKNTNEFIRSTFTNAKTPFCRLRHILPTHPFTYAKSNRWYLKNGLVDRICYGIIGIAGFEAHSKYGEETSKDWFSNRHAEVSPFHDRDDYYLRYRNASSDRIPIEILQASDPTKQSVVKTRALVIACIENPIRDPIYVLSLHDILEHLSDENRKLLLSLEYRQFDNIDNEGNVRYGDVHSQLLYEDPDNKDNYWISYDPSRVDYQTLANPQHSQYRKALVALRKAIDDASYKEFRVDLCRGDVLVVDNYRALTRRKERPYNIFDFSSFMRPPYRHMRIYSGTYCPHTLKAKHEYAKPYKERPAGIGGRSHYELNEELGIIPD